MTFTAITATWGDLRPRVPETFWCVGSVAPDAARCPLPRDGKDGFCWAHRLWAQQCAHVVFMLGGAC